MNNNKKSKNVDTNKSIEFLQSTNSFDTPKGMDMKAGLSNTIITSSKKK